MSETKPTLPGYRISSCDVEIPDWALTAHPNEIRARAARAYPGTCWESLMGVSIPWFELIRFAEDRLSRDAPDGNRP